MSSADGANDFEIANKVSDLLKDIVKDRQQRILRWVAESIGMPLSAAPNASPETGVAHDTAAGLSSSGQVSGRAMDIKSFVDSKSPKSDMQFAAAVAYYHRFEAPVDQRRDSISAEILQDAARLAGRSRLAKPVMTLNNAKKQGYLDTVGRGQFRINSVGENLVAMALPSIDSATTSARTRPSRTQSKKRGRKQTSAKKVAPRTARR